MGIAIFYPIIWQVNTLSAFLRRCQLYTLRLLRIDTNLVFDHALHFEKIMKKPNHDHLYFVPYRYTQENEATY